MSLFIDPSFFPRARRSGISWLGAGCILIFAVGCGTESKTPKTQQTTETDGGKAVAEATQEDAATGQSSKGDEPRKSAKQEPSQDKSGTTAGDGQSKAEANAKLWQASADGDVSAVRKALEGDADVHARNRDGNTALMLAAFYGHEDVVELLLDEGAEVNARNPEGRTPLMFASTFDSPDTVELLLDNDAMVNLRDNQEKFTALMFAASEGHVEVVQLLLEHGADKTLVDVDGDTAADFARRNGHDDVVELLE